MKVAKLSFSLIVLLMLFVSCSYNKDRFHKVFSFESISEIKSLEGVKHEFVELINPKKIELKNKFLIIGESRRIDDYNFPIHIIDKVKMKYLSGKGKIGFGPGEISDAYGIGVSGKDSMLWVYSALEKRFSKFNIYDQEQLSKYQIKQDENFFMATAMAWSSDSSVVCRMANDPKKFVEFKIDGTRLAGYGLWQNLEVGEELNDFNMGQLNHGWFKGNREKNIYVNAGYNRDHIEILHKRKGEIYTIDGPRNEIPKYKFVSGGKGRLNRLIIDEDNPKAYRDVCIGDEYIYGLYSGYTRKEILREGKYANDIFVFNYQGDIIDHYKIDISLSAFTVDDKSGKIYGITADENPGIAVFNVPD
ncbi:hypothetical protein DN752_14490 [Echinicola strongylocentroti]|uniref:TolB-like 6-blade propeller-like n=1 Tax=Echinicola strongylocentroti TaxID=1795355 RepID=A0A2Z4ILG9_9BACT|nr:BF3164 family lipoprotein [Echinicola strongylocentroti]AWW31233.1 hypothetical protein DN752_14490 [Echinicola strongylocentroti]